MKWYSYLDDSTDTGAKVLASAVENNGSIRGLCTIKNKNKNHNLQILN